MKYSLKYMTASVGSWVSTSGEVREWSSKRFRPLCLLSLTDRRTSEDLFSIDKKGRSLIYLRWEAACAPVARPGFCSRTFKVYNLKFNTYVARITSSLI